VNFPTVLIVSSLVGGGSLLGLGSAALAVGMEENAKEKAATADPWSDGSIKRYADLVASYYSEEAVVCPPADATVADQAAVRKYLSAGLSVDPSFSASWKVTQAEISKRGDFGFTRGTYVRAYTGPDGKRTVEKGKYVAVWRKDQDGTWKPCQDIWNADPK